ncbi:MAG: DUF4258 domain-containing protein [Planctomycetota bacterium]
MRDAPYWWDWELVMSPHVVKRMASRDISELDIRDMAERADGWSFDPYPGRVRLHTTMNGRAWRIVVEPQENIEAIEVVTTFAV